MTPNTKELSHARVRAAVRSYLNKWEAWEKKNGKDAIIGNSEWAALSALAQRQFQELDDYNYIGDLNEWITKNATGSIPWDEEEFPDPVTKQRLYQASVRLPGNRGVFPREDYGFEQGEEAPAFTNKRKARQFAAKHAMAWLQGHGHSDPDSSDSDPSDSGSDDDEGDTLIEKTEDMPDSLEISEIPDTSTDRRDGNVKTNRPAPTAENSPNRKKAKVAETEAQMGARLTSPGPGVFSKAYASTSTSNEPPSIPKQVDTLAKIMGFDVPKYTVTGETDGTWSGRPVFQLDGRMPEDLGIVTGLESEAQARAEMARAVLAWLGREYKRRSGECDMMLEDHRSKQDNPLINGMIEQLGQQLRT